MDDFDVIPVRLPSGTKAIVKLPRPFTLEDGIHLMNFLGGYIEEKQAPAEVVVMNKEIAALYRKLNSTPLEHSTTRFELAVEIDMLKIKRDKMVAKEGGTVGDGGAA